MIIYSVSVTTASKVATEFLRRPDFGRRFFGWQHNCLLLATHA